MNLLPSLLLLSLVVTVPAPETAGGTFETVSRGSKSKVVEQYEINAEDYQADPRTAKRQLTYVELYNDLGKVVESWNVSNETDPPRYSRRVFTYDRYGRTTAQLTYESAKAAPNQFFSVSRSGRGIRIIPEVGDSLSEVKLDEYDRSGNLVEHRWTNGNGELKQKFTYTFDRNGNQISFRNVLDDGTVLCETTTVYSENGRLAEQTFLRGESGNPKRIVYRRDMKGRSILEEQYTLNAKSGNDNKPSLVLTSRSVTNYSGEIENVDWTIWNEKGEPDQRLLIVSRGDDVISEKKLTPAASSAEAAGKISELKWVLASEEIYDYQYDNKGNVVRETRRQRPAPDKPFRYTYVIEKVITYF